MHSRTNEDSLLLKTRLTFWIFVLTCDSQIFTFISCQCSTQSVPMKEVLSVAVLFYSAEIISQIRISVRKAVSEVYLVIVRLKLMRKGKGVVIPSHPQVLSLVSILVITYLWPNSVPSNVSLFLRLLGESQDLHSVVIKRVRLGQIQNVEFDFQVFASIGHSEEVPLGVSIGVDIILED